MTMMGILLPLSCNRISDLMGDELYVKVNGERITEEDVKQAMPMQYDALRRQYDAQMKELLQQAAINRLLELEAKESNKEVNDYIQSVTGKAPIPSNDDVETTYNQLVAMRQIDGSLQENRGAIMQFLIRQNEQQVMRDEISRLKKKYNYEIAVQRAKVSLDGEPIRGGSNASITIVEFSDFECPFCKRAQKTTSQLRDRYGDKIKWVFKDFPLNFHAHAMSAHLASQCVYRQDEKLFWRYFDEIFNPSNHVKLDPDSLRSLAVKSGVDMAKYDKCLNDPAVREEIDADIEEGKKLGVSGTPAFFINGILLSGAQPLDEFVNIIESEM